MKKNKRRAKRMLKFFIFVVVLALIMLIFLYAPLFNIKSIQVMGATRYTPEKIKEVSGVLIGENGFRKLKLSVDAILGLRFIDSEDSIEKLPYIKECRVCLVFPNKVVVKITERQPAAFIRCLDSYLTVDGEGFVLESNTEKPKAGLKEIQGIEFTKYTLGGQLELSDLELVKMGVKIIETIKNSDNNTEFKLFDVLDWVDMIDRSNAILSLDNRIVVRFNPQDKLQYNVDFTKEIFFKKINSHETGRIEFAGDQNPSFIPD